MILKIINKKSKSIIDKKQKFTAVQEYTGSLKHLYEIDIKSRYKQCSPEHVNFLQTLQIFQDSTSKSRKIAYTIHYTGIPLYELGPDLRGWFVFKLTIGLNKKMALNFVVHTLKENFIKKGMEVLQSRVVNNPEKVDASVYFEELNRFLKANHPGHKVDIINQKFFDE